MAKCADVFKQPGFKTRIMQREANFRRLQEIMPQLALNPCRELDFGKGIVTACWGDPAPRKPAKIRAVNKWEDFDTHRPKGWRTVFRDSHRYTKHLLAHGFKSLGSGFYSTVLGHPNSDRVIKICRSGDDAYPLFAAWAAENPSPFLPRIHSFKRHNGFYVVVLDRLERTTAQSHPNEGWSQTTDMIQGYARGHEFKGMRKVYLDAAFGSLPGLKDVVDRFVTEFRGQASFDMHDGNWMLSKDGQLVMTDPLAGTDTDKAYERNSSVKRIRGGALRGVVRLAAA